MTAKKKQKTQSGTVIHRISKPVAVIHHGKEPANGYKWGKSKPKAKK